MRPMMSVGMFGAARSLSNAHRRPANSIAATSAIKL